jgi:hypothetical protein
VKKKIAAAALTILATLIFSYLFIISIAIGFLASKSIAGKSTGERGKLRSILIPLGKWRIHLHHWLFSLWLISISIVTGMYFIAPGITYGTLGGATFQGIYCYKDWHIILIDKKSKQVC